MDKFEQDSLPLEKPPIKLIDQVEIPLGKEGVVGTFMSFDGLEDGKEHFAVGLGNWKGNSQPLVRIHSECMTGDVFGSLRCDCGPQLQEAISTIVDQGGFIIYLRQEGRGIGLYKKFTAYKLQDLGLNTYEANEKIGFERDSRVYRVAAQVLSCLDVDSIKLLTNNFEKVKQIRACGITVERVKTSVFVNEHNVNYLTAKNDSKMHSIQLF
ncbi:MAG: GTP cyclohydrolase II [Pedobacter sp.]|nr:MAG: GTP cyclohydrolase II [Pedobacter sp.]